MTDLCVMCGAILPAEYEDMVCRTCRLTAGIKFMKFNCPDCGRPMEVWSKQVVDYSFDGWSQLKVDLIYHCECGKDWDSEYYQEFGDESQSVPKRHYWG